MYSLQRKDIFQVQKNSAVFFQNPLNKQHLQAFLKSHFALRCKQINKRFIYHERNSSQDISSGLLKNSVEKFCCPHLETDIDMFFFYSNMEYDETAPVLIDSEDTNIVVTCGYAASIVNCKLLIKCKRKNFSAKDLCSKEMSKVIMALHVMTRCDLTSSFLVLAKELCGNESRKVLKLKFF